MDELVVSPTLWRTAVHEAGHAVACKALGVAVISARADEGDGEVLLPKGTPTMKRLIVLRASLSAERIVGHFHVPGIQDGDRADMRRLLRRLPELGRDAVHKTVGVIADDIIQANCKQVEHLAALLCEYEELSGGLLEAALGDVKTIADIEREREVIDKYYRKSKPCGKRKTIYAKRKTPASGSGSRC